MSTQENTIKIDEPDFSSAKLINAKISCTIGPGQGCVLPVDTGRSYSVNVSNIDDYYPLEIWVNDYSGAPYQTATVIAGREHTFIVGGDSGKIGVYNNGPAHGDKPLAYISVYRA